MKIYEIVNMYNFYFDRRFYFENKTTFIDIFLVRLAHSRQHFVVRLDTVNCCKCVVVMHALKTQSEHCALMFSLVWQSARADKISTSWCVTGELRPL